MTKQMKKYKCLSDECGHVHSDKEQDAKVCSKCGYAVMVIGGE